MDAALAFPSHMSDEDRALIERAREWRNSRGGSSLTADDVREVTRADGIELATAVLYEHLRAAPRNQALIESLESTEATVALAPAPGAKPRLVVMPGAFHGNYSHTGADGARLRELAAELAWSSECVPVPSLASMEKNAVTLVEHLARHAGEPKILVSLSKGGADVLCALPFFDRFDDVKAWLDLSGMVHGTPLVAWLRARPLRCWGIRLLLRLRGQRFAVIEELSHTGALDRPMTAPANVRVIHVRGFPLRRHLRHKWAARGYERLAPLGPNDGGGILLADALRLPGEVYPVWGADHYLQPDWDIRPALLRLLRIAAS
jgi:hypothetical protein